MRASLVTGSQKSASGKDGMHRELSGKQVVSIGL